MVDRRTLRRMFLSAFKSEGLDYLNGGCQVTHPDLTWSMSLVVDGTGPHSPYRVVLGASFPTPGSPGPRNAEECPLYLPVPYANGRQDKEDAPYMPEAAFPDWQGTEDERGAAIAACIGSVARYARRVDSVDELRARYEAGDLAGAFVAASMRQALERPS